MDEKDYTPTKYIIPSNMEGDRTIRGVIKYKCLIEAIIFLVLLSVLWRFCFFSFSLTVKIISFFIMVVPVTILALLGINDESLVEFLLEYFAFRRKRRKMIFKIPRVETEKKKGLLSRERKKNDESNHEKS